MSLGILYFMLFKGNTLQCYNSANLVYRPVKRGKIIRENKNI
jgi:hypothetical protein